MSSGADNAGVRFPPPFIYVGLAALAWWLDRRWPVRPPAELVRPLDLLGLLLAGCGLLLAFASLALFARAGTSPVPHRPANAFVVAGTYRLTRNPMYLGLTLVFAGIGLSFERPTLVLAALAAAAIVDRWVIPREERYLEARFGSEYLDYKRRVRRWL